MKKRSSNHIISSLIKTRQNDRDMIMNSILVAIGVNILSSGIVEIIAPQNKGALLTIIGSLICIAVAIHISYSKYKMLNRTSRLEGVFIHNRKKRTFVPIFDYAISENMQENLVSACTENKALKKNWECDFCCLAFCRTYGDGKNLSIF